jgi:hypothetical protein
MRRSKEALLGYYFIIWGTLAMPTYSDNPDDRQLGNGITLGVALVTVGGVLMGYGSTEAHGKHALIWSNSWFASGSVMLIVGIAITGIAAAAIVSHWVHLRQNPPTEEASTSRDPVTPIYIRISNEDFSEISAVRCVFSLQATVINLTDKDITLSDLKLQCSPGKTRLQAAPLADEALQLVAIRIKEMKDRHRSDLLTEPLAIPGNATVSGWFEPRSSVKQPGCCRPACTLSAVDNSGNIYKLEIAGRPKQVFRLS